MKRFNITVNGKAYDVAVEEVGGSASASAPAAAAPVQAAAPAPAAAAPADGLQVKAPMPGNILDVKANVGDSVAEGQVLMVLEAMKMENDIVAPKAGKIVSISVKKGDGVNRDDLLATIQ